MSAAQATKSSAPRSSHSSATSSTLTSFDDETRAMLRRENLIFPLFCEMAQRATLPRLEIIFQLGFILQFSLSIFWFNSTKIWDISKFNALNHLFNFNDFSFHIHGWDEIYYVGWILLFFIFCCFVWNFYQVLRYRITHTFSRWQLIFTRLLDHSVLPTFIIPVSCLFGRLHNEMMETSLSGKSVPFEKVLAFLVSLIFMIGLDVLCFFTASVSYDSPYIIRSILSSWDPYFVGFQYIVASYASFIPYVTDQMRSYVTPIAFIPQIMSLVYIAYRGLFIPFMNPKIGFIFPSILLVLAIESLVMTFHSIFKMPHIIDLIVLLVSLVGCLVFFYIYYMKKIKQIDTFLSYSSISSESKISDKQKREHFDTMSFFSTDQILMYLHVGLLKASDMFIDFSFVHYIVETYPKPEIVMGSALVLSLFPSQLQFFGYCLGQITHEANKSYCSHYLIYQLKKVHATRQSSLSSEVVSQIHEIQTKTTNVIAIVRNFWKNIAIEQADTSFGAFLAISKSMNKVNSDFIDSVAKYSHNQEMLEEYVRFLAEGVADFLAATSWSSKAKLLELGKSLNVDPAFRSLVNTYPFYLIDNILDIHGQFIKDKKRSGIQSQPSSSNLSSSSSASSSTANQDISDMKNTLISEPRLRLALQRYLAKWNLPGTQFFTFAFVIELYICIIFLLIFIFVAPSLTVNTENVIDCTEKFTFAYQNLVYASLTSCSNFLEYYIFPTISKLIQSIISIGNPTLISTMVSVIGLPITNLANFPSSFKTYMKFINEISDQEFNDSSRMLYDAVNNGFKYSQLAIEEMADAADSIIRHISIVPNSAKILLEQNDIFLYLIDQTYVSTCNPIRHRFSDTLKGAFLFTALDIRDGMKDFNDKIYSALMNAAADPTNYLSYVRPLLLPNIRSIFNTVELIDPLEEVKSSLLEEGIAQANELRSTLKLLFILFLVLFFSISFVFSVISSMKLRKGFDNCVHILRGIKPDVAMQSLKPILVASKDETVVSVNSQPAALSSFSYQFIVLISILICIAFSIFVFLPFFISFQYAGQLKQTLTWNNYASTRLSLGVTSFVSMISAMAMNDNFLLGMNMSRRFLLTFENAQVVLMNGDNSSKISHCIGYDKTLDSIHILDKCPKDKIYTRLFDYYQCSSVDKGSSWIIANNYRVWKIMQVLYESLPPIFSNPSFAPLFSQSSITLNQGTSIAFCVPTAMESLMVIDTYLSETLIEFQHTLIQKLKDQTKFCSKIVQIISGFEIISALLISLIVLINLHSFKNVTTVIKKLILFLPPGEVISNSKLFNFLVGDVLKEQETVMAPAEAVIFSGDTGAIILSSDQSIFSVNDSFTKITGLTPDELLGQNIQVIFPPAQDINLASMYETIEQMLHKNGINSTNENITENQKYGSQFKTSENLVTVSEIMDQTGTIVDNINAPLQLQPDFIRHDYSISLNSASGKLVTVDCSLYPSYTNRGELDSFILLFHDRSSEAALFEKLSTEMEKSQHLLQALVPDPTFPYLQLINPASKQISNQPSSKIMHPEITKTQFFTHLNSDVEDESEDKNEKLNKDGTDARFLEVQKTQLLLGNQDDDEDNGLFMADNITVIVTRINGLLDCVQTMLPSNMFEVTAKVYALFDEIAEKYSINTIHSVDNILIGCVGLFSQIEVKEQVKCTLEFAIELNHSLEEVNLQLSTDLHFMSVIDFGGPAIGGLLSPTSPNFYLESKSLNKAFYLCTQFGQSGTIYATNEVVNILAGEAKLKESIKVTGPDGSSETLTDVENIN